MIPNDDVDFFCSLLFVCRCACVCSDLMVSSLQRFYLPPRIYDFIYEVICFSSHLWFVLHQVSCATLLWTNAGTTRATLACCANLWAEPSCVGPVPRV